ncbi:hypothetical protein ACBJ59_61130 [Nonomuraea sp. MTCD27]|uniref:hypothetical protein n=1 Tax=Nonomuraea sp. MTCD27 TaxID=1676747 RepID=UPI0035C12E23
MTEAFRIDEIYDRDQASDGVSRYGSYVRRRRAEFAEAIDDHDRVSFAALAWRVATGPIMAPGYVRQHARVRSAHLARNYEDGGLYATVELVGITPRRMEYGSPPWRSWLRQHGHYYVPEGSDLISARYLLTTTTALFPLATIGLPICSRIDSAETAAKRAVHQLAEAMNDVVTPLIQHLDREDS